MTPESDFPYYFWARTLSQDGDDHFRRFGDDVPASKTLQSQSILRQMDTIARDGQIVFDDGFARLYHDRKRSRFLLDLLPEETDHLGRVAPLCISGILPDSLSDDWIASTVHYAWQFAGHTDRTLSNQVQESALLAFQRLDETLARDKKILQAALITAGVGLAAALILPPLFRTRAK